VSDLLISPVLAGELVRSLEEPCYYLPILDRRHGWYAIFYCTLARAFPKAMSDAPPFSLELQAGATNDKIPLEVRRASCNETSLRLVVGFPARASRFLQQLPYLAIRAQTRRASERLCVPHIFAGQL
jgi:hypothetical protein